jgi:cohesin complex subunit SA-1/2
MSGESSENVASQWISKYTANDPEAMTELVNLVLRSAGCNIEITGDDINDSDNAEGKIADLQEEYQAVSAIARPLEIETNSCSKT